MWQRLKSDISCPAISHFYWIRSVFIFLFRSFNYFPVPHQTTECIRPINFPSEESMRSQFLTVFSVYTWLIPDNLSQFQCEMLFLWNAFSIWMRQPYRRCGFKYRLKIDRLNKHRNIKRSTTIRSAIWFESGIQIN